MAESAAGDLVNGRYRLVEVIGTGGMGRVWRALDEMLDREVAVKEVLLPPGLVGEQREQVNKRSVREARSAARLSHPGIITVHDIVMHQDAPMIVMEYVPGPSLAEAVEAGGRMSVARVVEIGLIMAGAVKEAHALGVVHRDLKPQNVLLAPGRVIITDFGIARLVGDATLTRSGAIMGTPAYMAPEQAHSPVATPEGDIWSLGATLYSAVEGRPPFPGTNYIEVLTALITSEPQPARHAGPLGDVLARVLIKDPDARPGVDELIGLLSAVPVTDSSAAPSPAGAFPMPSESIAPGLLHPGPRTDPPDPGTPPRQSSPAPGGFGAPDPRFGTPQPLPPHPSFPPQGPPQPHPSFPPGPQGITPRPSLTSHDALPAARPRTWRRRDLALLAGLAALSAAVPAAVNLSREPEKKLLTGPAPIPSYLSGLTSGVRALAFSPDGSRLVSAGGDGLVWWNTATRARTAIASGPNQTTSLAFSPDGKTIAAGGTDGTVWLIDATSHQKRAVLTQHKGPVRSVAFSPGGEVLASGADDDTIWLWDPATGKETAPLKGHKDDVHGVAFSPDGKTLASGAFDRTVRIWNVGDRREEHSFTDHRAGVTGVAFSSDGKTVASSSEDQTVRVWDVPGLKNTHVFGDHADTVLAVAFSPDGRTLASAGWDNTTRLWNTSTWQASSSLTDQSAYVAALAYARTTGTLATGSNDRTIRLY
ncbi:serine/threonine-protein kinase [Actinocorallia longicatena]|uniref:WD40 repeat domain-containing serine/threonine protein kinase n=1 Tax=Actinocorallia longicatena TaxID=111803 RepID=UPI0031D68A69